MNCVRYTVMAAAQRDAKQLLRQTVKQALRQMDNAEEQRQSDAIASRVLESPFIQRHNRIGCYVHAERLREVDTSAVLDVLLAQGPHTRCYVPLVVDNDSNMKLLHLDSMDGLRSVPPFGIREPSDSYSDGTPREDVLKSLTPLDVLIMPGLAFDIQGGRLGRGGGYYDHFVSRCVAHAQRHDRPPPLLVALAFKAQIVDSVPMMDHDRRIDVLVTADGVHQISERGQDF